MRIPTLLIASLLIVSCTNKKEEGVVVSDAMLFEMSQSVSSFSYFRDSEDTLSSAPESPHFPYVRIRFNPRARSAMNDSISALTETEFPDQSMIVKEIYDQRGGPVTLYAIMYKLKGAANGGAGWVWNEVAPDGSVVYSAGNDGLQCVPCHSSGVQSDLVRTFALH